MSWSGYFGIENIALTAPQKATLVAALRSLGPSDDPQPAELMHSRTRLDNDAVIFRARFQDGALTVALFGGTTATTAESNSEVLGYLAANAAAWGDA